jgi:hypothetical protein
MTIDERIEQWRRRPFSWSQHQSFRDYDKEEWYSKYILGNPTPTNKRMAFGSAVGKRIETDPTYIPQLPRGIMEYGIEVMMNDITLVGYMDAYEPETKTINEYKTSSPAGWDQEKVDNHGQLTLYCLLLLLKENINPEDVTIQLHHMHTEESGDFSIKFATPFTIDTYTTKRTTEQALKMGAEIIKLRKEMEEYVRNHE